MTTIDQAVATLDVQAEEIVEWAPLRFRVRTYLSKELPPLDMIMGTNIISQAHFCSLASYVSSVVAVTAAVANRMVSQIPRFQASSNRPVCR